MILSHRLWFALRGPLHWTLQTRHCVLRQSVHRPTWTPLPWGKGACRWWRSPPALHHAASTGCPSGMSCPVTPCKGNSGSHNSTTTGGHRPISWPVGDLDLWPRLISLPDQGHPLRTCVDVTVQAVHYRTTPKKKGVSVHALSHAHTCLSGGQEVKECLQQGKGQRSALWS